MATATEKKNEEGTDEQAQNGQADGPETFKVEGKKFTVHKGDDVPDEGKQVPLGVGARVEVVSGPGTQDGKVHRMASIQEVYYRDLDEALKAETPHNPGRRFAEVSAYDVLTRDGRSEILHVKPEDIRESSITDGWGRGTF